MIERLGQSLFLPTVLLGFAFFGAQNVNRLPADAGLLLEYLPYASLLLVALIASAFNRGRSFIAATFALLILLADQYVNEIPGLHTFALILVTTNLALLAYLPERGTLTSAGMTRITLVLIQIAAVVFLAERYSGQLAPYLSFELMTDWPQFLHESQPAVLIGLLSVIATLVASTLSPSPITQSLFTANVAVFAILITRSNPIQDQTFHVAVALALAIGLMKDYYNMAYRDELTGLPQRRALNESLTSLGGQYTIAMLDVDHFKKFNDTHGHDVGDQVLQMVASQIRKVQGGGKAYRYGGEEFTVVFAKQPLDEASYLLDMVRKSIENYEMVIRENERIEEDKSSKKARKKGSFRKAGKKVSVTISIGVAERQRPQEPEDVLKRADEALYRAKKAGRNQVAT